MMLYEIALTFIKGIGDVTIRSLLSHFGSAEEIFKANKHSLMKIPGIGEKTARSILDHQAFDRAEEELKFIERYKIQPLFIGHKDYPKRLLNCDDAPFMLYYKGNADLNKRKVLAVVGTRNATPYGIQFCDTLISGLKSHDMLVVSGLAYGIDIASHKAALAHGLPTIGVLGHGLDRIYPALHRKTAEQMLEQGGLLTEFPSASNPERANFPRRNRIIAGMADAVIVVEATRTGGALITAEIANTYNKDVFAVPGRVDDEFSEGCNFLIKTNRASVLTRPEDIEYIMGWFEADKKTVANNQLKMPLNLTADEQKIVALIMENDQMGIDEIQFSLNLSQSKVAFTLLNLEMNGVLISLPGKRYRLNA